MLLCDQSCCVTRAECTCIIPSSPGLLTVQFLHTASDQKLDSVEQGYMYHTFPLFAGLLCAIVEILHVLISFTLSSPFLLPSSKVTFTPHTAGNYEAVLQVWAQLVVGGEGDGRKASSLTSRVILKALAEEPKLEVSPACPPPWSQHLYLETLWIMSLLYTTVPQVSAGSRGSPVLDYGVLVGGTSTSLPLRLTNHGSAELPLKLSVSAVS